MKTYRMTFEVKPITKKNSPRLVKVHDRVIVLPSAQYVEFKNTIVTLKNSMNYCETFKTPINLQAVFYMPTRRRVDLTNLLEALDDALVAAGILGDDNCTVIVGHDGSRVKYDKARPRIEIEITDASAEVETEFLKRSKGK